MHKCCMRPENKCLEAVVLSENTETRSQSTEDLSVTDSIKVTRTSQTRESSDSGTNSSSSAPERAGASASAPERAGASPDIGRVKQSDLSLG
jgi:hypothetical protein